MYKNRFSKFVSPVVTFAFVFSLFAPITNLNAASSTFSITGTPTVTATISGFQVDLTGTATVTNPNKSSYGVSVIWGAGTPCVPATFNFTGTNPITTTWTATHTFTTPGSYTITALVHHSQCQGAESADASITFTAVIPTENCLNGIDDDFDGLVDLSDPDCLPFFPHITVTKNVVNDNGGTKTASNFSLFVDTTPATSGVTISALPGTHTVSETLDSGYTQTSISGDCAPDGTITVVAGNNYNCTITNNDKVTPALSITNSPVTYNGSAQSAVVVGSVAGVVSDIKYGGSSVAPTNVGTYAVTADFAPTDTSTYASLNDASAGDFVINKADPNCGAVSGYSGVYDASSHGGAGACTGVLGENLSVLDLGASYTDVPGGSADWTLTDSTGNYNNASGSVSIDISPRDIIVNADEKNKTYGDPDPSLTYGVSGSLFGNIFSGNLTRDLGEDVGDYNITQGTLSLNSNFNLIFFANILHIDTKATLMVTADDQPITYGDSDPTFTFSYSGFKNGDDESVIDTPPTCEVSGDHSNAGTYAISCSGGSDDNYSFSYTSGTLTVNPKSITVTAEPKTKVFGTSDPALTYLVTGLVGSDTLAGALVRVAGENAGTYSINQGTVGNSNYSISYVGANFTITKADSTTIVTCSDVVYNGSAQTPCTVSVTGAGGLSLSPDPVYSNNVNPGIETASASYTYEGDDNHNGSSDSETFSIATLLHIITATAGSNGTVLASGLVPVADGTSQTFTIIPNPGFHVADVLVDGVSVGPVTTYTFTGVTTNHTITATFASNPQCSDTIDNDGDGKTDYPADRGCESADDPDETNSGGGRSGTMVGGGGGQVLGVQSTCGLTLDTYMKMGWPKNNPLKVKILQQFLNDYMQSGLVVDGAFGPLTDGKVKAFQTKHADEILKPWNIANPTGLVYLTTVRAINNIGCPELNLPIPTLINWDKNPNL